eukprot:13777159-Heterocapsa_arctica.AAC.1
MATVLLDCSPTRGCWMNERDIASLLLACAALREFDAGSRPASPPAASSCSPFARTLAAPLVQPRAGP